MNIEMFVERESSGHEHRGPENGMRFQDIFGYEVVSFRPKGSKKILPLKLQPAHVVDQCIKPDIGDVVLIEG